MSEVGLKERIQKRLEVTGKSPRSASIEAGGSASLLQNLFSGKSKSIRSDYLTPLAAVLETSVEWLATGAGSEAAADGPAQPEISLIQGDLVPVRIAGTLEAGAFREVDEFVQLEPVTIFEPRDPRFPNARMMGFDVAGDSMNDLKPRPIIPGDRVVCIDFEDLRGRVPLRDGMVVVVEQVRDGGHLREWSVKQLEYHADRVEFWPRSTNPKHKPIVVPHNFEADDGRTVSILALVRRVTNELPLP